MSFFFADSIDLSFKSFSNSILVSLYFALSGLRADSMAFSWLLILFFTNSSWFSVFSFLFDSLVVFNLPRPESLN